MPPSAVSLKNLLRRFRRHRRGSAAVEFALVAPIFFALLFAIVEVALMFFATQVLETVTQASARYRPDRTGAERLADPGAIQDLCLQPDSGAVHLRQRQGQRPELSFVRGRSATAARSMPAAISSAPTNYCPGNAGDHRVRAAVLPVAAVRHRARLQHVEPGRATSGGSRRPRHSRTSRSRRRRRVAEERCNEGGDLTPFRLCRQRPRRLHGATAAALPRPSSRSSSR